MMTILSGLVSADTAANGGGPRHPTAQVSTLSTGTRLEYYLSKRMMCPSTMETGEQADIDAGLADSLPVSVGGVDYSISANLRKTE